MSVGLSLLKADFDQKFAGLSLATRDNLAGWVKLNALMNNTILIPNINSDAFLTGLGYSAAEVGYMRSAPAAMKKLSDIAYGLDVQTPASNFMADVQRFCGVQA